MAKKHGATAAELQAIEKHHPVWSRYGGQPGGGVFGTSFLRAGDASL